MTPSNYYPQYGVTNPTGQQNSFRMFLVIAGWIIAFAWPVIGAAVNYVVQGTDIVGLILVPFLLGPVFFFAQAILNVSYLALPKEAGITTVHLWIGHVIWWGGSLLVAAVVHTPGGYTDNPEQLEQVINDPAWWDNLWSMLLLWAAISVVGYVWVIVGIVVAVRDADIKRKYAYRQRPWGSL